LVLNFSSKFVVFQGRNGAGKTNILEAISLFAADRGLRKASMADMSSRDSRIFSWNLELVLKKEQYKTFLSVGVQNGRRTAKIDNDNVNSLAKFEEILWLLWVAPSMDSIFSGASADRRSFFDHLASGYDKKHKRRIHNLNALQKERLHVMLFQKDKRWLTTLEEKIAWESIQITKTRLEFIKLLHETFAEHPSSFLRPFVNISGVVEKIYENNSEENALLELIDALRNSRSDDAEKQITSVSVQRTMWRATAPQTNLEAGNCSTGEQKAFLISIILAIARIYLRSRNGIPVLLLDDLLVHLDKTSRQSLIEELLTINVQTFFTGTDSHLFEGLSSMAQVYHVEKSICTESR
jgi:DNA replication and repair protein RecF